MNRFVIALALMGCKSDRVSCDAVLDNIQKVSPPGTWAQEERSVLLGRCSKLSDATRSCLANATAFRPMMDCYRLER